MWLDQDGSTAGGADGEETGTIVGLKCGSRQRIKTKGKPEQVSLRGDGGGESVTWLKFQKRDLSFNESGANFIYMFFIYTKPFSGPQLPLQL